MLAIHPNEANLLIACAKKNLCKVNLVKVEGEILHVAVVGITHDYVEDTIDQFELERATCNK